jgi:hypothetical protein
MKTRFMRFLPWTILFCLSGTTYAVAEKKPCNREEAMQAETATDSLKAWNSVYRFYKQFSHCDDGGIAEGVSDAVAKLLANRWGSVIDFVKLASNDKGFENFVVRHVDDTIDWSHDAPLINENARLRCPSSSSRLCKILIARTTPQAN